MEKASLIRRYVGGLLLITLIGLGSLAVFIAKGDTVAGIKLCLLTIIPGGFFFSLWFLVELKIIRDRLK